MTIAMQPTQDGSWEVFECESVNGKYIIEECDSASDAVSTIEDILDFDELYEEEK